MSGPRTFGALIAHDGVTLVEYRDERTGFRIVEQWHDGGRSASIDEALARLAALVDALGLRRARIALAVEQFGVLHHLMTLPPADDAVVAPIVKREVQRVFGVADPVVAFSRGALHERREPARADERTAPRQVFVAAAPAATVDALRVLASRGIEIEIATVVPKALQSLYEATGGSLEATAVLVCLESGPHLAFFLDGRLELAIDPPIALEGDRPTLAMILDQVERGAVYFRQQFRGATAGRALVAARADEYDAIAAALESRLGTRVKPLFTGVQSPEAVVAMGAVMEARSSAPLDLFPHPPTMSDRIGDALRGPNGLVAGAAAAALLAALWGAQQVRGLSSAQRENQAMRAALAAAVPQLDPLRRVALRRADVVKQAAFVRGTLADRERVTRAVARVSAAASDAIVFDSLRVARGAGKWTVGVLGSARGGSAAQAVNALDSFLKAVRSQPDVVSANLDDFDYPAQAPDSMRHGDVSVTIRFHMSLGVHAAGGAR